MSDGAPRGPLDATIPPVTTVPIAAHPPIGHPRATQMSASAVPSTLESPQDPPRDVLLLGPAGATLVDQGFGATLQDDTARDNAIHEASRLADAQLVAQQGAPSAEPSRRYGPATLASKAPGPNEGGVAPGPRDPLESAVVDAVLPPAAFLPAAAAGGTLAMGNSAPLLADDSSAHAQWGAPGPHAGAFEARAPWHAAPGVRPGQDGSLARPGYAARDGASRRSSTTMIVLIIVGVVVVLGAVGLVAGGALLLGARRAAATRATKASPGSDPAEDPGLPAVAPAVPTTRAMGGTKARLSTLTSGPLEIERVRTAIGTAMPRIDACFATNELEPPNHESVAYDLEVAASGAVKSAEPGTLTGRTARLDTCVVAALRAVRMPRSPGGGRVKLTLEARIAEVPQSR